MQNLQVVSLAWEAVLKIVTLTGAISAILAAIGTWLLMRFTKPLDSYSEEFAKQIARHQNLDKLAEETRRLTDTAEKIKSELAHENWDRQTRFIAKRDLYVRTVEVLADLRDSYVRVKGFERLRLQGVGLQGDPALFEEKRREALDAMQDAQERWSHATAVAPLMMPDEPFMSLLKFRTRKIGFGTSEWEADVEYNILGAQWALYHFQVAARKDLGFAPMEWKPVILTPPPAEQESSEAQA